MDSATHYRLDDLTIDLARQRVERGDERLNVTGLSFQLLRYLIIQGERVVGFGELIEHVWAPAVVNEETVTQRVKLLRQALGDDGRSPRYLRSVRGQGYQLCHPPKIVSETVLEVSARSRFAHTRTMSVAAIAVLVVAVGVGIWWLKRSEPAVAASGHASGALALNQRASYYAGIGQRDNNERAIELYQRALHEAPENIDALLGLSRAYSARVCLFNFPPEWAERAQQLADQVIRKEPELAAAHAARGYAFDCRGRIDEALAGYERALQLDPAADNSRASAAYLYDRKGRLADALTANTSLHGDPSRVRYLQLQIAGNLDLLGYPQAAEARYRRSFELYPDNVFFNIAWPRFLFRHGRLSEAQAALAEAMGRGTDHSDLHLLAGEIALLRGDRAAASVAFRRASALRPQSSLPTTMMRLFADKPDPGWARERAADFGRALAGDEGYPFDWLEVALLQDAGGDRDAALSALQHAVDAGYRDAAYLQVSPLFKALTSDPAFARSIDAINLRIVEERRKLPASLLTRLTASP
jgi:DNA-binding winged helix-turn-helix (wHTH) protein/tetratricopeptide (TPR) repeat protein